MNNFNKFKKKDLKPEAKIEGMGPSDKRVRSHLGPAEDEKRSFAGSLKRALAALGGTSRLRKPTSRGNEEGGKSGKGAQDLPSTFTNGGKGIYPSKNTVECAKCAAPGGKCSCENQVIVAKPSNLKAKVTSNTSDVCECPKNNFDDETSMVNYFRADNLRIGPDIADLDHNVANHPKINPGETIEPSLSKTSVADLINAQFDTEEFDENDDDFSEWSFKDLDESEGKINNERNNDPKIQHDDENDKKTNYDKEINDG